MNWVAFRKRVFAKAGSPKTIPESYDAIRLILTLLGDRHGFYMPVSGRRIYSPQSPTQSTNGCTPPPPSTPQIPPGIGYVRIQITPQTPAAAIQDALRDGSRRGISRWIVDLRNSRGGNMWPALAGVGSLLGEGTVGYFIDAAGKPTPWKYANGHALLGNESAASVANPVAFLQPTHRVAVLTDIGVASSGEAIAIAFRSRPNTRSFGTRTCGLSTGVRGYALKNGAFLGVVGVVMADRNMTPYGGPLDPDVMVADPNQAVRKALDWLVAR